MLKKLIPAILTISLIGCSAAPIVVDTACPKYPDMPGSAKEWIRRALAVEESASFRAWLADVGKLKGQLALCESG